MSYSAHNKSITIHRERRDTPALPRRPSALSLPSLTDPNRRNLTHTWRRGRIGSRLAPARPFASLRTAVAKAPRLPPGRLPL